MLKIVLGSQVFGSCDFGMVEVSIKYFSFSGCCVVCFLISNQPGTLCMVFSLSSSSLDRLNGFYTTDIFLYPWRSEADHRNKGIASALANYRDGDNQSVQGEKSFQITFHNALCLLENGFSLLRSETRYLQRHTILPLGHSFCIWQF